MYSIRSLWYVYCLFRTPTRKRTLLLQNALCLFKKFHVTIQNFALKKKLDIYRCQCELFQIFSSAIFFVPVQINFYDSLITSNLLKACKISVIIYNLEYIDRDLQEAVATNMGKNKQAQGPSKKNLVRARKMPYGPSDS